MSVPQSVSDVLKDHVVLEVECIDRMYLNVYVPQLQWARGVASSCATTVVTPSRRRPWEKKGPVPFFSCHTRICEVH